MNAFIPQNPRIRYAFDGNGNLVFRNNIDPELKMEKVLLSELQEDGLPFDSRVPQAVPQVLAHGKH
jgi:hypothetical protein